MTFKILICGKNADEGIKLLEERGYQATKAGNTPKTQIPNIIAEYDALIMRSATKITTELLTLKNLIATPHIGAQTREAQLKASIQIAQKIIENLEKHAS